MNTVHFNTVFLKFAELSNAFFVIYWSHPNCCRLYRSNTVCLIAHINFITKIINLTKVIAIKPVKFRFGGDP